MPVTFDNAALTAQGAAGGASIKMVLTAAANAVLLCFASNDGTSGSISTMEYGGASLSLLGTFTATSGVHTEVWGLTAPGTGALTLSAAIGGFSTFWAFGAVTYLNAKTVAPFGGIASASVSGANANFSISCSSTDLVVFGLTHYVQQAVLNNGTQRLIATVTSDVKLLVGDIAGQASRVSVSATGSSTEEWMMLGVPIRFSAVATTSLASFMSMTGCGR